MKSVEHANAYRHVIPNHLVVHFQLEATNTGDIRPRECELPWCVRMCVSENEKIKLHSRAVDLCQK